MGKSSAHLGRVFSLLLLYVSACGYVRFASTPMAQEVFVAQGPGKARGAF
jgi:hypothetical protein